MGIIDLLKDIPISAILREKIIGLESENKTLRLENESLKIKLSNSEEQRRALEDQVSEKRQQQIKEQQQLVDRLNNELASE